jgi:hypothetical protein
MIMRTRIATIVLTMISAAGAADEKHPGKSFVLIGNSISNPLRMVDPLAKTVGHPQHRQEEIYILGASPAYNWEHPEGNHWPQKLAADKPWDAMLILCGAPRDTTYAPKFAGEAFKANPRCQVLIYNRWPFIDEPYDVSVNPMYSERNAEEVGDAIAAAFPQAPPAKVVPSSLLLREMYRLADRGEMPGRKSRHGVLADNAHPGPLAQYGLNLMVCAILYNEDALTYPEAIIRHNWNGKPMLGAYVSTIPDPAAARVVRQLVADILATYPRAGMTPRLAIADRQLPAGLADQPYRHQLKVVHGAGDVNWSVAHGALPNGITLDPTGLLAGKPATTNRSELVLRATAGNGAVERKLTLDVVADKPLTVTAPSSKPVALDEYVMREFKADGAVGHAQWTLATGALPHGLTFNESGMLHGTPGEAGEFAFTVRVQDEHPQGARTAERAVTLSVGPADVRTLAVRSVPSGAVNTASNLLTESFWKFDQPVPQSAGGQPASRATFGLVWEKAKPRRNTDPPTAARLWLAVRVLDGPAGRSAKDGVHIYIDGNHDKQVIYNEDDSHFFLPRAHKGGWLQVVRSVTPNWGTGGWVREIPGGYEALVQLNAGYFHGRGNWLPFGPKTVYGFDLIVDDATGRRAWHGTKKNDEDTSLFGSILLVNEPAVTPDTGNNKRSKP